MTDNVASKFWLNDINVLYKDKNYEKFVPTSDMDRIEQLNAATRFCIYLFILFLLMNKTDATLYLPVVGIVLIIIFYNISESAYEHMLQTGNKSDNKANQNKNVPDFQTGQLEPVKTINEYELDSGMYDMDMDFLKFLNTKTRKENIDVSQMSCAQATKKNNPFANQGLANMNTDAYVPCNADADEVDLSLPKAFNPDYAHDIDDVFDKKIAQRQFFTVARSIPNDQEGFARWCYDFPASCKLDQTQCMNYPVIRTASSDAIV